MRVALLLYPLLELWSLILLGAETSAGLAVLWVLGTGFAGIAMIRLAGAQVLSRFRAAQRRRAATAVVNRRIVARRRRAVAHHSWLNIRYARVIGTDSTATAFIGLSVDGRIVSGRHRQCGRSSRPEHASAHRSGGLSYRANSRWCGPIG